MQEQPLSGPKVVKTWKSQTKQKQRTWYAGPSWRLSSALLSQAELGGGSCSVGSSAAIAQPQQPPCS